MTRILLTVCVAALGCGGMSEDIAPEMAGGAGGDPIDPFAATPGKRSGGALTGDGGSGGSPQPAGSGGWSAGGAGGPGGPGGAPSAGGAGGATVPTPTAMLRGEPQTLVDVGQVAIGAIKVVDLTIRVNVGPGMVAEFRVDPLYNTDPADVAVQRHDCARVLSPGQACAVAVQVSPKWGGTKRSMISARVGGSAMWQVIFDVHATASGASPTSTGGTSGSGGAGGSPGDLRSAQCQSAPEKWACLDGKSVFPWDCIGVKEGLSSPSSPSGCDGWTVATGLGGGLVTRLYSIGGREAYYYYPKTTYPCRNNNDCTPQNKDPHISPMDRFCSAEFRCVLYERLPCANNEECGSKRCDRGTCTVAAAP